MQGGVPSRVNGSEVVRLTVPILVVLDPIQGNKTQSKN